MSQLAELIQKKDSKGVLRELNHKIDVKEFTPSLLNLAIKNFPHDATPILALFDVAISTGISLTEQTMNAIVNHDAGPELLLPHLTKIILLNQAIEQGDTQAIKSICGILELRGLPIHEAFLLKALQKLDENSQESVENIANMLVKTNSAITDRSLLIILNTKQEFSSNLLPSLTPLIQKATLTSNALEAAIKAEKEDYVYTIYQRLIEIKAPLDASLITLTFKSLLEARTQFLIFDAVYAANPELQHSPLPFSSALLKEAILQGREDYVVKSYIETEEAKVVSPEQFIKWALKSRLNNDTVFRLLNKLITSPTQWSLALENLSVVVNDLAIREGMITVPDRLPLIPQIINKLVETNELSIKTLQNIISSYSQNPGFGAFIPTLLQHLSNNKIIYGEEIIIDLLEKQISHSAHSSSPSSSQIIINLLDAIINSGKRITEDTLFAALSHPDSATIVAPIIDGMLKTHSPFLHPLLRAAVDGLVQTGHQDEVIHSLTHALLASKTFDPEKLAEDLIVLAIEKFANQDSLQAFMTIIISKNGKITQKINDALLKKYGHLNDLVMPTLLKNITLLAELNTAIQEQNLPGISKIFEELAARRMAIPEKMAYKAIEQLGIHSAQAHAVVKLFLKSDPHLTDEATAQLLIKVLESNIESAFNKLEERKKDISSERKSFIDYELITSICTILKKEKLAPLSETALLKVFSYYSYFSYKMMVELVDTILISQGQITEKALEILMENTPASHSNYQIFDAVIAAITSSNNLLSLHSLEVAISKGRSYFVNSICKKLRVDKINVPEKFIIEIAKSKTLDSSSFNEILETVLVIPNSVSEKTLIALLPIVLSDLKNKEAFLPLVINAIASSQNNFTEAAWDAMMAAYKNQTSLAKYVLQLFELFAKQNHPQLEDLIISVMELRRPHSGGGSLSSIDLIKSMLTQAIDLGQPINERTLSALIECGTNKKELMPVIIDAIIKTKGTLSSKVLETAINKGDNETILTLCDALKKNTISIGEELIQLALQKLMAKKSGSSVTDQKNEAELLKVLKALLTLAAPDSFSEKLLMQAMEYGVNANLLQEILESTALISLASFELAIAKNSRPYLETLCLATEKCKEALPESLLIAAANSYSFEKKHVLELLKSILASGGKVSEKSLIALIKRFGNDQQVIETAVAAINQSKENISLQTFETASASQYKNCTPYIVGALKTNNMLVPEKTISEMLVILKNNASSSEKYAKIEAALLLLVPQADKLSSATLNEALKIKLSHNLLQTLITQADNNISIQHLSTALTSNYYLDENLVVTLCQALEKQKIPATEEQVLIPIINKFAPRRDGVKEEILKAGIAVILASNNKISEKSLIAITDHIKAASSVNSSTKEKSDYFKTTKFIIDNIMTTKGKISKTTLDNLLKKNISDEYADKFCEALIARGIKIPSRYIDIAAKNGAAAAEKMFIAVAKSDSVSFVTLSAFYNKFPNRSDNAFKMYFMRGGALNEDIENLLGKKELGANPTREKKETFEKKLAKVQKLAADITKETNKAVIDVIKSMHNNSNSFFKHVPKELIVTGITPRSTNTSHLTKTEEEQLEKDIRSMFTPTNK